MEPPSKKLRYSDPDLTILVESRSVAMMVQHQVYAADYANKSKFIDSCLSSNEMKGKNGTKVIILQAPSPQVFEKAIQFLESPIAARSFDEKDAMELIEFYSDYEFDHGIELCDQALLEYFEKYHDYDEVTPPDDLDFLVKALVVADNFCLKHALDAGIEYVDGKIEYGSVPYDASMFSLEHVKSLHPMMIEGYFWLSAYKAELTKEEIESPLFPKYFLNKSLELATPTGTSNYLGALTLSGSNLLGADGVFEYVSGDLYASKREYNNQKFVIFKDPGSDNDWTIARRRRRRFDTTAGEPFPIYKTLWKCPYSRNLHFPPTEPWLPTNTETRLATPKIRYYSKHEILEDEHDY